MIAIAHRLSTLRNFDRILVLQEGRLIEDGAPEVLMRRRGAYYRLVDRELTGWPSAPRSAPARRRIAMILG